jgi:hypothetical protein
MLYDLRVVLDTSCVGLNNQVLGQTDIPNVWGGLPARLSACSLLSSRLLPI